MCSTCDTVAGQVAVEPMAYGVVRQVAVTAMGGSSDSMGGSSKAGSSDRNRLQ